MSTPWPWAKDFVYQPERARELRLDCITALEALPQEVREAVKGLSSAQLDTPYREGSWTVRQVVHHLADSHLHAYARMKWALTEDAPVIKPYEQDRWSELSDARSAPIAPTLLLLDGLHARWTALLRTLSDADWQKVFTHPELPAGKNLLSLNWLLQHYAWHGRHHVEQIRTLRHERKG